MEHGVGPDGTLIDPSAESDYDKQSGNVFFMVDNKDRYVPRTTIVDTEPTVVGASLFTKLILIYQMKFVVDCTEQCLIHVA